MFFAFVCMYVAVSRLFSVYSLISLPQKIYKRFWRPRIDWSIVYSSIDKCILLAHSNFGHDNVTTARNFLLANDYPALFIDKRINRPLTYIRNKNDRRKLSFARGGVIVLPYNELLHPKVKRVLHRHDLTIINWTALSRSVRISYINTLWGKTMKNPPSRCAILNQVTHLTLATWKFSTEMMSSEPENSWNAAHPSTNTINRMYDF